MAAITRRTFLVGGASSLPYLYLETLLVAVRRYQVQIRRLPPSFEGFTILHLTDLHDKGFGNREEKLLSLLSREGFDAVAMTGDMVQGANPSLRPALDLVAGIRRIKECPIYAVSGNHEWRLERGEEFAELLRKAGVAVLVNESVRLSKGKDEIRVLGVDDPVTNRDRLDLAVQGTDRHGPRLLLSHSPHTFLEAAGRGIDLVLAGHTHGGQVRLPFLGASFVPSMGFFPCYDYGLYRLGGTSLVVGGGLGESLLPIRFNMRPEIALITLRRSREAPPVSGGAKG